MVKIFYAERSAFPDSKQAVQKILYEFYGIKDAAVSYTENGKPYLEQDGLHFSLSHTDEKLFIAFSKSKIGIDAEAASRSVHYQPILKRLHPSLQKSISSREKFLRVWTILESAVKYLGGTLAQDLSKLSFTENTLQYDKDTLPATVKVTIFEDHFVSVCSEDNFDPFEFTKLL